MRQINKIIVHCAYTSPDMNIGVAEIDTWHRQRGFRAIGYHYVINRQGGIEAGRSESEIGAHTIGHNSDSIGICLAGGKKADEPKPDSNFTWIQMNSLRGLVNSLLLKYPGAKVFGHRDFAPRDCPCFDVKEFMK
jgi:N-acetyl-anhydromuramyl-L-alanine amidase AmpD